MNIDQAYKFCPRCGALIRRTGKLLKCPACDLSFYLNPKPVTSVILINDKDEILFAVRGIEPQKGMLDFPGGFAEEDEDFEQSARRELKEELGIEVGKLKYHSSHIGEYLFEGIDYKVLGVTYLAKLPPGAKIKVADDVAAVKFYKLSDVPMDELSGNSERKLIEALKQGQDLGTLFKSL